MSSIRTSLRPRLSILSRRRRLATQAGVTKDAVIRVAAKIADAKGWDALTLAQVAAKLRIRSPSLYNHVDGLEALRRELKRLAPRVLGAPLSRAAVGKPRHDAVRRPA